MIRQHTVLTISAATKSAADFGVILTVAIEIQQGDSFILNGTTLH